MLIPQVGSTLVGFAFVLASITSVIASSSQSQCLNRELVSAKKAKSRCAEQGSDDEGRTECASMKESTDCNKLLVDAASKCSPSRGSVFLWLNRFNEDFYCKGKSVDEQISFSEKMLPCEEYLRPGNAPGECKDVDFFKHEEIWSQSPPEVCNSTQKVFDCYNKALKRCGLNGHSLDGAAFGKAMTESGCPFSGSPQFVPNAKTVLWWAVVVTGLAWFH